MHTRGPNISRATMASSAPGFLDAAAGRLQDTPLATWALACALPLAFAFALARGDFAFTRAGLPLALPLAWPLALPFALPLAAEAPLELPDGRFMIPPRRRTLESLKVTPSPAHESRDPCCIGRRSHVLPKSTPRECGDASARELTWCCRRERHADVRTHTVLGELWRQDACDSRTICSTSHARPPWTP